MGKRRRGIRAGRLWVALAVCAAALGGGAALTGGAGAMREPAGANVVVILADDLSNNLVPYMRNVKAMSRDGANFTNYYVTDSLCCPSRSSIFTGEFPHNTHVLANKPPMGGVQSFNQHGGRQAVYAKTLQGAGYETGMMGKYINGYESDDPEPPYWDEWDVVGQRGTAEYGYRFNQNGDVSKLFGFKPQDYLVRRLQTRADDFIHTTAETNEPFVLEVAPYATHSADPGQGHRNPDIRPFFTVPDPRDDSHAACAHLKVPRTPNYDARNVNPPSWLGHAAQRPLTKDQKHTLDRQFCKRAETAKSLDRLVGSVETAVEDAGVADNTYVIFTSDNGFHTGQHRLLAGKMTAFETDIRVPLIVTGPGIQPGTTIDQLAENIDLAPTLEEIAGTTPPESVDGHSLLGLLHGTADTATWRRRLLVEHRHATKANEGPDKQPPQSGDPTSYRAVRGPDYLYVRYQAEHGHAPEHEYYALGQNPNEIVNTYKRLSQSRRATLDSQLDDLRTCAGAACWTRAGGG